MIANQVEEAVEVVLNHDIHQGRSVEVSQVEVAVEVAQNHHIHRQRALEVVDSIAVNSAQKLLVAAEVEDSNVPAASGLEVGFVEFDFHAGEEVEEESMAAAVALILVQALQVQRDQVPQTSYIAHSPDSVYPGRPADTGEGRSWDGLPGMAAGGHVEVVAALLQVEVDNTAADLGWP